MNYFSSRRGDVIIGEIPRHVILAVPSRIWDPISRQYTFPATPAAAYDIQHAAELFQSNISFDSEVSALAKAHVDGLDALNRFSYAEKNDLFFHQKRGVDLITKRGSCYLAFDMGTGKTRTCIEAIKRMNLGKILIVSPKLVCPVWNSEFKKWSEGFRVTLLNEGSVEQRSEHLDYNLSRSGKIVIVINYDAAWRKKIANLLLENSWDMIIADEIHRTKQPGREDYKSIMRSKDKTSPTASHGITSLFMAELAKTTNRRVGLSGTPIPNSPIDLWAQMRFVDAGLFDANYGTFHYKHVIKGGWHNKQAVGIRDVEKINNRFYSLAMRVKKEDVLDLPEYMHVDIEVELGMKARMTYDEIETSFVASLPDDLGTVSVTNALVELLRLQQVAGGHIKTDAGETITIDTAKEDALVELMEDMPTTEAVVVFSRFREHLEATHRAAKRAGRQSLELSGSRHELEAWQKPDGPTILAVQIQSGGLGVSMVRSRYAVFYDQDWSPASFDQACARLHRMGQRNPVTYYHLLARRTVDQRIRKAVERKEKVIEMVLKEMKQDVKLPAPTMEVKHG